MCVSIFVIFWNFSGRRKQTILKIERTETLKESEMKMREYKMKKNVIVIIRE